MPGALISKLPHGMPVHGTRRDVGIAGKVGWIQIVSEIKAQWSDRGLIANAQANRMRSIVVIALQVCDLLETEVPVGLMKAPQAGKHFLGPRKNVSHVLKNRKADVVIKVRHPDVWKTHLQIVDEHGAATDGISGKRVAGACLI